METKTVENNSHETNVVKIESPEINEIQETNFFRSKDLFEHAQRVAVMLSKSELVPKRYQGNIGNCVIALEMAYRMGASPLMIMQNLNVILGTPAWSSKFLIASLNACGRFSPLRYEDSTENNNSVRAFAMDRKTGDKLFGAWVSMKMAKEEGWLDKSGSKWKTMPDLMLRYRAASFFVNQFAPEISMGFNTVEEVYDIEHIAKPVVNKEAERIVLMIEDAKTPADLHAISEHVGPEQRDLFNSKLDQLTETPETKTK